jgi:hypothetical protein
MKSITRVGLIAAAILASACAHQFLAQAQSECSAFGFSPGTNEYAYCVQRQYDAGRLRLQQGLATASQSFGSSEISTEGGAAAGTGFFQRSYISGMNRICVYNRMGNAYVMTVGAADMCPMTVP